VLFNSWEFICGFLPVTLAGYYCSAKRSPGIAEAWLVLCSLVFYGWWNAYFVILLAGSVAFNYCVGELVVRSAEGSTEQSLILTGGIAGNLLLLFYYKYCGPVVGFLHAHGLAAATGGGIILPLGISFFTFTQIGYLVDSAEGAAKDRGPLEYALFVTFFPHLIAGPIVHHKEMMPQFADARTYRFDASNLTVGVTIFVIGLAKKVLLADSVAYWADAVFAKPMHLTVISAWGGAISYSMQLYFDFSGYSDMAIGLARMFGIILPLNFNSPYKSCSIIDFWSRWHMTLSRYLGLYLYDPIALWITRRRVAAGKGASRKAMASLGGFAGMVVMPLFVTMSLAGVWHGAGLQFLCFGLLHACYLSANHGWRVFGRHHSAVERLRDSRVLTAAGVTGGVILTYVAVVVSLVFFRAGSVPAAVAVVKTMASLARPLFHPVGLTANALLASKAASAAPPVSAMAGATLRKIGEIGFPALLVWTMPNTQQIMAAFSPALDMTGVETERMIRWSPNLTWSVAIGALLFVCLGLMDNSKFIYFQF